MLRDLDAGVSFVPADLDDDKDDDDATVILAGMETTMPLEQRNCGILGNATARLEMSRTAIENRLTGGEAPDWSGGQ